MNTDPATDPAKAAALAQACQALWLATLSLMTAFMQTRAPAHRLLLARRIADNFRTLRGEDSFSDRTRASFTKLWRHWDEKARSLSEGREDGAAGGWLKRMLMR